MATQLWNQEIDKTVDWGGDTSTGGSPVSGQFVQKFIKDTLAKKFGYLNYDKNSLKYQVFADYEDYVVWKSNPTANSTLLLATFDAPAPASIIVTPVSSQNVTILSSDKNQKISFNYHILDSSSLPMNEAINARILFNNGGNSQVLTMSYDPDYDGYNKKDENGNYIGTTKTIDIDEYLSVGTNNITVTLTGASSQAQTSVSFKYTVVELEISSGFDNTKAFEYDSTMDPSLMYDSQSGNVINVPYKCSGQGAKYIEVFINGKELHQESIPSKNAISFGTMVSGDMNYTSSLNIFMTDKSGNLINDLVDGKNSLQFRIYVEDSDKKKIYSQTLYYDFIVREKSSSTEQVFILYSQTLNNKEEFFIPEDVVEFNTQQYSSTSFKYSVYSSTGKEVQLKFVLNKLNEDDTFGDSLANLTRELNSGVVDTFEYTFMTYGKIHLKISAINPTDENNPYDTMVMIVNVAESDVQIAVNTDGLLLNLEALNRSNSEPENERGKWIDPEHPTVQPIMHNVYFNSSSGWDGKSLVLNNGATLEIPYAIFGNLKSNSSAQSNIDTNGLTFEMTFEMIDVQDEDAVMFLFKDDSGTNKSYIQMTASEARICDGGSNEVYTKFNANTEIKISFIVRPYDANWNGNGDTMNANFICINGILDKADMRVSSMSWQSTTTPSIIIGDKNGKAGIKVNSLRVYNKALSLDEELTNWIAESTNILKNYKRNTLNNDLWTGDPVMDVLRQMIPTVVIYGDIDKFNSLTGKKDNMQVDMEFYDPTDENRDFYARGMWLSPQGTSSMAYPIKNMRPYFSKNRNDDTKDSYAEYYTEVYHKGQFVHGQVTDESTLGHFYTNKKTTKTSLAGNEYYMHKCYNKAEAERLQKNGEQLFFAKQTEVDGKQQKTFIPCTLGVDDNEASTWYVAGYREVIGYNDIDTTWKVICDLRLSGQTLYKKSGTTDIVNEYSKNDEPYHVDLFKKLKGKDKIERYDENGEEIKYYIIQGVWKQYDKSGYTNVWTFKADYAESSMCNNAGTGRLWGDVMKNFKLDGEYLGRTNAQSAVDDRIDIRTSCDGKPIVVFCRKLLYKVDENNKATTTPVIKDGVRQYSQNAEYVGLYNIMTDKSSTPLFGFENIYDENGDKIYDAVNCECWECLSNAVDFPQGLDIAADREDKDHSNNQISNRQPLWSGYEVRWPDVDGVSHSHKIESLWRFINFCKDAVDYKIGGVDGYDLNPYIKINSKEELQELWDSSERPVFATGEAVAGNMSYKLVKESNLTLEYLTNNLLLLYYVNSNIDYENITKTVSPYKIETPIYIGKVPSWDVNYGEFIEGIQFDDERVGDVKNGIEYGDKIIGTPVEEDYYVTVYLTKNGSRYEYIDNYGDTQVYRGTPEDFERNSKGENWVGKTKMEYFSEKKYDWFNVYRLAAYYIYLIRFAAVDQVVKNSMLTTEDGQHFYYINYDNDTIFGVRNDGNLVYHWNITRNTFDKQTNSFAFAGPKSVLWNLLENDEDFMSIVKKVDNAMFTSEVQLSASTALDMYNNKQEGTWGERLYNINEEIKYLSQYDGSTATYLKFIHGSSNQYRSWFIQNRFNLYDSLWESGDYLTTKIGFRLHTLETDGKRAMFNITAARENKFFLSNTDGEYKDVEAWKIQIGQNETASWPAIAKIQGSSSPWMLYGSDKIKVLDFRPSIGIFELQQFSFIDGYDWPTDKGCLMTGFLIGNSDDYREKTIYRYTNVTDKDATLISTNIDATHPYTSSEKLNNIPEGVVETEVDGKWVYSSETSVMLPTVVLAPEEYYDRDNQMSISTEFKEETLDPTVCKVTSIGGIGKIYSLEEIDIRNCFNSAGLLNDSLNLTNLRNLHIFRAIGSSITSFEPAVGCNLTEVSLPKNRINKLVLDNVTFTPSYDENGELIPMLKYSPDAELRNLTLKNVTMTDSENPAYDVVEFINEWVKNYTDIYGSTESFDLKNLSLTLEGVDITADVEWLRKLKELNLASFTGNVFVEGNTNENKVLTQEEFDELNALYSNERPFEVGSALRFSSNDAIFWTVSGGTKRNVEGELWANGTKVTEYYEIIHDEMIKFRSTKFKNSTLDTTQKYAFRYVKNNEFTAAYIEASNSTNDLVSYTPDYLAEFHLVSDNSMSSFISNINGQDGRNVERLIRICSTNNDGTLDYSNCIYVKISKIVVPTKAILEIKNSEGEYEEVSKNGNTYEVIVNENAIVSSFRIKFENEGITVDSNKPSIIMKVGSEEIQSGQKYGTLENIFTVSSDKSIGGTFDFIPSILPTNTTIKFEISTGFTSTLSTVNEIKINMNYVVKSILPTYFEIGNTDYTDDKYQIKFVRGENNGAYNPITSIGEINTAIAFKMTINSALPVEGYKFPIMLSENANVPLHSMTQIFGDDANTAYVTTELVSEILENKWKNWYIVVKPTSGKEIPSQSSYDAEFNIGLKGIVGYDSWFDTNDNSIISGYNPKQLTYGFRLDASIIYPTNLSIVYNGVSITETPLIITSSDGPSKQFVLDIIPFNNIVMDDVTVPVYTILGDLTILGDSEDSNFVSIDKSCYNDDKIIKDNKLLLNLWKPKDGEGNAINKIQSKVCTIKVSAKFNYSNNKTQTISETEFTFTAKQSLASCSKIDDCEPYEIKLTSENNISCDWYFVDIDNQYYKFDPNIISKLQLDTLVGIAKRVQYGFTDGQKDTSGNYLNYEKEGNPFNNASEVWTYNPELVTYVNEGDGTSCKRSIKTYWRPLCIPLYNWKITEEMYGDSNIEGGWKSSYKDLNDKYGSWTTPRYPLIRPLDSKDTTNTGYYPDFINELISDYNHDNAKIKTFGKKWIKIALHNDSIELENLTSNVRLRNVSDGGDTFGSSISDNKLNYGLRLLSSFDIREATKAFCEGNDSGFSPIDTIEDNKLFFPGYKSTNYEIISGLVDIWHHFKIYHNNDKIKCYPASLFELDILFSGGKTGKIRTTNINDNNIDNTKIDMSSNIPLGIYEIYTNLNNSGCLKNSSEDNINLLYSENIFIKKLYDFFNDNKLSDDIFSSVYIMNVNNNLPNNYNSFGMNNGVFSLVNKNELQYSDKQSSNLSDKSYIIGSQSKILMIPLLYVD